MIEKSMLVDGMDFVPIKPLNGITISEDTVHTYGDDTFLFTDTSKSICFKMSNKQWCKVKRILGIEKPIYKKRRKGKRYVWYEVV